jgi:hypothetical protein
MASDGKRSTELKSAYELALERLEQQGIERPREEGLDPALRQRVAEVRSKTKAKLAEMEILHRDELKKLADPAARHKADEEYVRERRRLEDKRERDIERLRGGE